VTQGDDGKTTVSSIPTVSIRISVDWSWSSTTNGEIILDSLTANQAINGAHSATANNVAEVLECDR
jgi:hypothetical protein